MFFRCQKWIVNLRRADLSLHNVEFKRVCSVHFEEKAYCNPGDISTSHLLPTAVPTLITCPNPPRMLAGNRKPPTVTDVKDVPSSKRSFSVPVTENVENVGSGNIAVDNVERPIKRARHDSHEEVEKLKKELLKMRYKNKLLSQQVQRLRQRKKRDAAEKHSLLAQINQLRKTKMSDVIDDLPPVPAALIKVLNKKKSQKKIVWKENKEALELCLAIFFRSSSAYVTLRKSGFHLPDPKTLRHQYKDVLMNVELCPKLLEMVRIRCSALQAHKRVSLSFDGMTLTEMLNYHKD